MQHLHQQIQCIVEEDCYGSMRDDGRSSVSGNGGDDSVSGTAHDSVSGGANDGTASSLSAAAPPTPPPPTPAVRGARMNDEYGGASKEGGSGGVESMGADSVVLDAQSFISQHLSMQLHGDGVWVGVGVGGWVGVVVYIVY